MSDRGSGIGERGSGIGDRESALDRAIDRTVREMLDVQQPAGFRSRVFERIEFQDRVASTFRWKIHHLLLPIAAAAVLILAVFAPWRAGAPAVLPSAPQAARVETLPATTPVPAAIPRPPVNDTPPEPSPRTRVAGSRARVIAQDRVVAATVAPPEDGVAIAPLEEINPIQVPGVAVSAIAPRTVVVTPLAPLAQLEIAPLSTSAPDGRH
jgi:hypothetical protein